MRLNYKNTVESITGIISKTISTEVLCYEILEFISLAYLSQHLYIPALTFHYLGKTSMVNMFVFTQQPLLVALPATARYAIQDDY